MKFNRQTAVLSKLELKTNLNMYFDETRNINPLSRYRIFLTKKK